MHKVKHIIDKCECLRRLVSNTVLTFFVFIDSPQKSFFALNFIELVFIDLYQLRTVCLVLWLNTDR
jgi:hypothetical protein